ncbi:MAG: penicillin-binding protein 2, partial [Acidimicrobiia bacterium]|nr:penicillin-binding protein 2 [Acidimicrobiia bacterium]
LDQRLTEKTFAPHRGTIFDRAGREIAVTVDGVTVFANPRQIEDPVITGRLVAAALRLDESDVIAKLERETSFVFIQRQLESAQVAQLREMALEGIYFETEAKRAYPAGTMAAQTIGFVDIDGIGMEGLEYRYDEALSGEPGYVIYERDPRGRTIPDARGLYQSVPAEPGNDLVTTLDLSIQFMAEEACVETIERTNAKACTIVVLDPKTGEIMAMAVVPTFDPADRSGVDPEVFSNRAVRSLYEPGSTQKLVTVAAALEENAVEWNTSFDVPYSIEVVDQVFEDFGENRPTRSMTVRDIVTVSSNVGTILIQQRLGDSLLRQYLHDFGYGESTGVDFSGEATGALSVDPSCGSCTASAAIGYSVSVTPLQMASVYATIANGGVWVQPHLVKEIIDGTGVTNPVEAATRRVVSPATAFTMRTLLRSVVDEGTGQRAAVPGYSAGGKTGTTLKIINGSYSEDEHMASFIGMAPIDDPRLVVAVVIDRPIDGYTGGQAAAPAFATVMEKALHYLGVEPDAGR